MADADPRLPVDELHSAVREHGWLVVHGHAGDLPSATSTVGLTARGLPELVIVGLDEATGGALVDEVARRLVAGHALADGAPVRDLVDGGNDPCLDEPVRPKAALPAVDLYGDAVVVRQLVWADADGRLPGDPGFAHADLQPLVPGDPLVPEDDDLPREWPLSLDPHTEVRTSRLVVEQGRPVLVVCREQDGAWLLLDGISDPAAGDAVTECLHDALERDLGLVDVVARLEPGDEADRDRPGMPWRFD